MIALMMVFVKYGFLLPIDASTILDGFDFSLLVIAMISLAAGGNMINDIYDVEIDRINRPTKVLIGEKISEKTVNRWYIVLNLLGEDHRDHYYSHLIPALHVLCHAVQN